MAISIQEAAKIAKARTNNKRWHGAIDRAVEQSGKWVVNDWVI